MLNNLQLSLIKLYHILTILRLDELNTKKNCNSLLVDGLIFYLAFSSDFLKFCVRYAEFDVLKDE